MYNLPHKICSENLGTHASLLADPSGLQIFPGPGRGRERNFLGLRHGAKSTHRKWAPLQMARGDLGIRFVQPLYERLQRNPRESARTDSESKMELRVQFLQASAISNVPHLIWRKETKHFTTHQGAMECILVFFHLSRTLEKFANLQFNVCERVPQATLHFYSRLFTFIPGACVFWLRGSLAPWD